MVAPLEPGALGLEGRRILVTGAAQGLGQETAIWLSRLGAEVIAADIAPCDATLARADGRMTARRIDLGAGAAVGDAFSAIAAEGPVYGLVNCAGVLRRLPLEETTEDDLAFQTAINQTGTFFLARAAMGHMVANGEGRIVLYTSQGAVTGGYLGSIPYAMNKAAVTALVKSFARHAAPHGVTVNAVSPGAAETAMLREGTTDAAIAEFSKMIPMQRVGQPGEMAGPTVFLLSDWARFITGATIHVNGGQVMV